MIEPSKVCVKVDCRCPFSPDWSWYPKSMVGLHRINADDPRATVNSIWDWDTHCCGYYYSQQCEEEACDPSGRVVEVISDCDACPYKNKCQFKRPEI